MEQDRIHIKLARRTPEERQADETRRLDPFMRALKAIHTAATPETMNVEDLEKQRKGQELLGRLVAPMAGMSWEPFELDGMNCAWVRPHRGHDRRRAILYCHGGGYTSGNLGYSRILASKLANVTGWQVLSFEYRLAPEHPYPAASCTSFIKRTVSQIHMPVQASHSNIPGSVPVPYPGPPHTLPLPLRLPDRPFSPHHGITP